jgi:hypothetical protein
MLKSTKWSLPSGLGAKTSYGICFVVRAVCAVHPIHLFWDMKMMQ